MRNGIVIVLCFCITGCVSQFHAVEYNVEQRVLTSIEKSAQRLGVVPEDEIKCRNIQEGQDEWYVLLLMAVATDLMGITYPDGSYISVDHKALEIIFFNTRENCKLFDKIMSPL